MGNMALPEINMDVSLVFASVYHPFRGHAQEAVLPLVNMVAGGASHT